MKTSKNSRSNIFMLEKAVFGVVTCLFTFLVLIAFSAYLEMFISSKRRDEIGWAVTLFVLLIIMWVVVVNTLREKIIWAGANVIFLIFLASITIVRIHQYPSSHNSYYLYTLLVYAICAVDYFRRLLPDIQIRDTHEGVDNTSELSDSV